MSFLEKYLANHPKRRSDVLAYLASLDHLTHAAPTVAKEILAELADQRSSLKLIASENFSSLTVQLAMGNLLTDKYCEGYPHHRFYAGCEHVDAIEAEAVELAKQLFDADHAYVQPHSGADANMVAFWAILTQRVQNKELERLAKKSIDELSTDEFEALRRLFCSQKILGLSLSSGGHLTHGYRHNVSAKMFQAFTYDVHPETELIDYDAIAKIAKREKPLILLAGYSAYPRHIDFSKMKEIAEDCGAILMVDMAHFAGLVAGKAFTGNHNPIPFADIVTSTTHKTLRGPRGGLVLCKKEFTDAVNRGCPLVLGGPLPHVVAAKAIAFKEALDPSFQTYSKKIIENAKALSQGFTKRGLRVTTGGTDNHLIVVDLSALRLTGRIAELALREVGVTCNRNMIPFDPAGPWYTSGIRLGTPALTTLGMDVEEMDEIAEIIVETLRATHPSTQKSGEKSRAKGEISPDASAKAKGRVATLLKRFPLYPEIDVS